MTRDVLVRISGLHQEPGAETIGEDEAIEVIVPGTYYMKNGKHYLFYEEIEENGMVTKNQMKIFEDQHVEIRKSGMVNAHMIFETGKKHPASYQTPFGQMLVAMDTRAIEMEEEEQSICIGIDYCLEVDRAPLADCRIEMQITQR